MKIIRKGKLNYTPVTYVGNCPLCDVLFETEILVAFAKNGEHFIQSDKDLIDFEVKRDRKM